MKNFIKLARSGFIIGGLILIFFPKGIWPHYYKPLPMGIVAIVYSFLIVVPAIISKRLKGAKVLTQFQVVLTIDLILCSIGSLGAWGLYQYNFPYDKLVHFFVPFTMVYFGSHLISALNNWSLKKSIIFVTLIVIGIGVSWEYIESWFAIYFHFGFFGTLFDQDSISDLMANGLGVVTALTWLRFYPD